ncbi:MAG TPA: sialidase family protein [Thermoleophilaceae bacterium]|nr:sialidase family protein [Thermoleophilaceae bacterium]
MATSRNGGRTWKLSTVPGISKCTGGVSDEVVDPWVSIGRKGVAYFASLPLSVSGFLVNRSRDGGLRWSAPTTADPAAGQTDDLPSVVATPRGSRRAYLTWSRFTFSAGAMTGGDVRFSRSIDGARTFSTPVVIHSSRSGEAVLESRLGLLADGSLLDVFGEAPVQPVAAPMEIFASRSVNGGRSWTRPVRIATVPQDAIVDPETGKSQYNFCCLFGAATGRHGAAYLGYTKVAGTRTGRVVVVRSKNGGRSWGRPRTAARIGAQVLEPAVALAADGTVGVTWYDFRNDRPGDGALTTDYWFAYSRDGGKRWRRRHLAGPFDLRTSRRTGRPLGVYQGLAGLRHSFAATFIQARPQAKRGAEDVFFARVTPPRRRR